MGCTKLTYQNFSFLQVIHLKKKVSAEKKRLKDYAGNYVYEDNTLQFFNHAEGYVEPDGSGSYIYIYQYKDNLQNIRLSYSDSDGNGSISQNEIKEESNFYPGGLKHKGYNNALNGREHKYKFGGKELSEELGLNTYDFGARNYMPDLVRWGNIDALSDANDQIHSSPYAYALNNPIVFIDPEGDCPPGIDCVSVALAVRSTFIKVRNGIGNKITNANRVASGMIRTFDKADKTTGGNGINGARKAQIYTSRYVKEFGDFSSINDVSVLTEGKNLSGEKASTADYGFAAAAVLLPISGSKIKQAFKALSGKTTTILGRLDDTAEVAKNLDNVKSGMNEGGFNVLNQPDEFWSIETNMKWLNRATERGDVIKAASDPSDLKNIFKNGVDGKKTVFGQEVDYLKLKGYSYNSETNTFIRN